MSDPAQVRIGDLVRRKDGKPLTRWWREFPDGRVSDLHLDGGPPEFAKEHKGRAYVEVRLQHEPTFTMASYRPEVTHVTVIEKSKDVLKLVQPHMPRDARLNIIHGDALRYWESPRRVGQHYDFAWHDIWSDPDKSEPHLSVLHAGIFLKAHLYCKVQGAWAFPRYFSRSFENQWGAGSIIR